MNLLGRIRIKTKKTIRKILKRPQKPLMVFLIVLFILFSLITYFSNRLTVTLYYFSEAEKSYHHENYDVVLGQRLKVDKIEEEGYEYGGLFYDYQFKERFNEKKSIWFDTSLFVRFDSKEYHITLDHNGGTSPHTSVTALFNKPLPALSPPEKQDYLFVGYFEPHDGKKIYNDTMTGCDVWRIPEDSTIYARWAEKQNIVLDKQGGEGGTDMVVAGLGITLPSIEFPTKEGYKFNGYYSSPNGKGERYYAYNECCEWNHSEPQTLYAHWTKSLEFDKQGGVGGTPSVDAMKNQDLPFATAPQKEGYTFDGYYLHPNGVGTQYYSQEMTPLTQWDFDDTYSITLYANWLKNYKVTLLQGNGQSEDIIVNKDRDMPSISNNLTKQGYLFAGYYAQPEGKGIQFYNALYQSVTKWDKDDGGTLYAHWIIINSVYTKTQDFVIMGEYPQTIASSQAVDAMRDYPESNGYYKSDFDGENYVKITANPFDSRYKFSNGQNIIAHQEYFFKVEPVKWKILKEDDGSIYVLSECILDKGQFHLNANNNWENATLRTWLNESFYEQAFSPLQRISIAETQLETKYTLSDLAYLTADKIILPSYEDMRNVDYGFAADNNPSESRVALTTDYARAIGAWTGRRINGKGYYWCRSGFNNNRSVRIVFADGNLYNGYLADDEPTGIRPAMYIRTR